MGRAEELFRRLAAVRRRAQRRRLTISSAILIVALASLFAYAKSRREAAGPYRLADDCPRGALVYAQASDLPTLVRLWDGSRFRERYLASTNYRQFAEGHVALKLVARAGEFGAALGFTPDLRALAEVADKGAAVAVYDVGRMELVFVAPAGEEKVLAARFFQSADDFEKTELPDGTVYYGRDVEADRGRQKQKILFAYARGRFILATSEQLMLRALANVNGRARADRLSDDPSFKTLSRALTPHLAAVWVDQSRLNADYYFKHYWAMSDASSLKIIRAGLFDFEMREGSFVERREFLTEGESANVAALSPRDARELNASLPADAAYMRLRVLSDGAAGASSLVRDALLDRAPRAGGRRRDSRWLHEEFDATSEMREDDSWSDYSYLGDDYDASIDDASDSEVDGGLGSGDVGDGGESSAARLARALERARPEVAAFAESPVALDAPLFAEFRRLAIVRLEEPSGLDAKAFEDSITSLAVGRLTAAGTSSELKWSDAGSGARRRRELELPMLGRKLCYAMRGRDLFVSNDADFLDSSLGGVAQTLDGREGARFAPDDLTVIRLDRRREAFDAVFDKLDAKRVTGYSAQRGREASADQSQASREFFSGNVAGLLDAASPVARVEIRRRATPGRLREEVELSLAVAAANEAGK